MHQDYYAPPTIRHTVTTLQSSDRTALIAYYSKYTNRDYVATMVLFKPTPGGGGSLKRTLDATFGDEYALYALLIVDRSNHNLTSCVYLVGYDDMQEPNPDTLRNQFTQSGPYRA